MIDDSLLFERASEYAHSNGITLRTKPRLGHGSDGSVWRSSRHSAVKALYHQENYEKELECYSRLKAAGVTNLGGFDIPVLEGFDAPLQVIEMSIVQPPYLLDFGKVHLDRPPPYWGDEQLMANAYQEWQERFDDGWLDVLHVLELLKKYGIYYVDPRPGNIDTGDS